MMLNSFFSKTYKKTHQYLFVCVLNIILRKISSIKSSICGFDEEDEENNQNPENIFSDRFLYR